MGLLSYIVSWDTVLLTIPMIILAIFGILELLSLMIGLSVFKVFDDLVPDEVPDSDVDIDQGNPLENKQLSLLDGHVPFSIVIVGVLGLYSIFGLLLMAINFSVFQVFLPGWSLALLDCGLTILAIKPLIRGFARVIGVETTAITIESLVGHKAVIVVGTAQWNMPAEAKVEDKFGQNHFVRVVPLKETDSLPSGSPILLIEYKSGIFSAIPLVQAEGN